MKFSSFALRLALALAATAAHADDEVPTSAAATPGGVDLAGRDNKN